MTNNNRQSTGVTTPVIPIVNASDQRQPSNIVYATYPAPTQQQQQPVYMVYDHEQQRHSSHFTQPPYPAGKSRQR